MKKVLIKDITIKAGTVFDDAATNVKRYGEYVECAVGLTKDTCGTFVYPIDEDKEELKKYFIDLIE
jgi:hypothetical protein